MINRIMFLIKKICFAFIFIYSFDLLVQGFGIVVPINIISLLVVTFLGCPGIIMLVLSFFLL